MLHRVSVAELKRSGLFKNAYRVVVMQYYPRFLAKAKIEENIHALAPQRTLFTQFKAKEKECRDHNLAFEAVNYESRFEVTAEGRLHLERLSQMAREKEVFLVCQCLALDRCHADLLLLTAKVHFQAPIQRLRCRYPVYEARLAKEIL